MSSSLSNLVNNLAADEIKNISSYECEDCNNKLDYLRFKDNNILFKCFQYNSWYKKQLEHDLINKVRNAYEFSNTDISKFILEKVFIHINIWIVGKDLMKHHCLIKKLFIEA